MSVFTTLHLDPDEKEIVLAALIKAHDSVHRHGIEFINIGPNYKKEKVMGVLYRIASSLDTDQGEG